MADKNGNDRIWDLLAKKLSGEISQDEQEELQALFQQHSYASYVNEVLEQDWKDSYDYYQPDKIAALFQKHKQRLAATLQDDGDTQDLAIAPVKKGRVRNIWRYAAAACLAFAIIAAWKWWPTGNSNEQATIYQQQLVTPKGIRSQIVLPDGSKVWLNAGSVLDYPKQFNDKTRDVQLKGEAYFEITTDKRKPFFVHTQSFSIKVLGTGFNVRAYADEDSAVAALVHGSVEVIIGEKEKRSILLKPNEKITLPTIADKTAGEKFTDNKRATTIPDMLPEKMITVEDTVQLETAWTKDKLAFKKMPLANVALLLEKWFGSEIRFKNENKKTINLSGVYKEENLDEILYSLEVASGNSFQYKKDSSGVIWIE